MTQVDDTNLADVVDAVSFMFLLFARRLEERRAVSTKELVEYLRAAPEFLPPSVPADSARTRAFLGLLDHFAGVLDGSSKAPRAWTPVVIDGGGGAPQRTP
jgi:hypothetical protein